MRSRTVLWFLSGLLLAPALLLTAARLSGSDASPVVKLVSFTPAGVLLYAGALVLLMALAARRGRRRGAAVTAAVASAGLVLHLVWVAPWFVAAPAAEAGAEPLRVLTANLLGDAGDGPGLVDAARDAEVDVLTVQEVSPGALAEMERAGLGGLFPFRAGQPHPDGVTGTMVFAREPITDVRRLPTAMGSWATGTRRRCRAAGGSRPGPWGTGSWAGWCPRWCRSTTSWSATAGPPPGPGRSTSRAPTTGRWPPRWPAPEPPPDGSGTSGPPAPAS